jgi:hypothetical protein
MALLLLQAASELIKRIAFLRGAGPRPIGHGDASQTRPRSRDEETPATRSMMNTPRQHEPGGSPA